MNPESITAIQNILKGYINDCEINLKVSFQNYKRDHHCEWAIKDFREENKIRRIYKKTLRDFNLAFSRSENFDKFPK